MRLVDGIGKVVAELVDNLLDSRMIVLGETAANEILESFPVSTNDNKAFG